METAETIQIPEGWGRVYALSDPRNPRLPVYVGRTISTLRTRLWDHYGESKKKKNIDRPISMWIRNLRSKGFSPTIYTLETAPMETIKARENYWITFFRPLGSLLNIHDGDGVGERAKMSDHQKAITAPFLRAANEKRKKRVVNELGVVHDSINDASKAIGVHENRLKENISKGWPCKRHRWKFVENLSQSYEHASL